MKVAYRSIQIVWNFRLAYILIKNGEHFKGQCIAMFYLGLKELENVYGSISFVSILIAKSWKRKKSVLCSNPTIWEKPLFRFFFYVFVSLRSCGKKERKVSYRHCERLVFVSLFRGLAICGIAVPGGPNPLDYHKKEQKWSKTYPEVDFPKIEYRFGVNFGRIS